MITYHFPLGAQRSILDFRLYLRDNYPSILEIYYKTGEYLGSSQTRSIDLAYWESQADSKKSSA